MCWVILSVNRIQIAASLTLIGWLTFIFEDHKTMQAPVTSPGWETLISDSKEEEENVASVKKMYLH